MHRNKNARFILSLLIERTLFAYNKVLSEYREIPKGFKLKIVRLLVETKKYLHKTNCQSFDNKSVKYQYSQYTTLMYKYDRLLKKFDDLECSERIRNIFRNNLNNYVNDSINHPFPVPNPNYDTNYIRDFADYFVNTEIFKIKNLKLLTCDEKIRNNKFYLLKIV